MAARQTEVHGNRRLPILLIKCTRIFYHLVLFDAGDDFHHLSALSIGFHFEPENLTQSRRQSRQTARGGPIARFRIRQMDACVNEAVIQPLHHNRQQSANCGLLCGKNGAGSSCRISKLYGFYAGHEFRAALKP